MDEEAIIRETAQYIRVKFSGEGSGHDWWHVHRSDLLSDIKYIAIILFVF
jgi:hypothetical protein